MVVGARLTAQRDLLRLAVAVAQDYQAPEEMHLRARAGRAVITAGPVVARRLRARPKTILAGLGAAALRLLAAQERRARTPHKALLEAARAAAKPQPPQMAAPGAVYGNRNLTPQQQVYSRPQPPPQPQGLLADAERLGLRAQVVAGVDLP